MPTELIVLLISREQTFQLGECIGRLLDQGGTIALTGAMGTGKSTLAAGIAHECGSSDYAASPTFNLLHVHHGRIPVFHFDVWRLKSPREFEDIGGPDYFYADGISIVEWAERISEYLPDDRIEVLLQHAEKGREAFIRGVGRFCDHPGALEPMLTSAGFLTTRVPSRD
ncbi:MAG: hypothetical protein Kow00107_06160 [Planctomycetota bacterium]